jgi:hypothetical protein
MGVRRRRIGQRQTGADRRKACAQRSARRYEPCAGAGGSRCVCGGGGERR